MLLSQNLGGKFLGRLCCVARDIDGIMTSDRFVPAVPPVPFVPCGGSDGLSFS